MAPHDPEWNWCWLEISRADTPVNSHLHFRGDFFAYTLLRQMCARVLCSLLVAQASKKVRFHPNMDAAMVERTPNKDMVGFWQGENYLFLLPSGFSFFFSANFVIQQNSGDGGKLRSTFRQQRKWTDWVWGLTFVLWRKKKGSFTELQPTKSRWKRS